jgi:uncharacterized protein YjbJ (UPF0337 family)
MPMKGLIRTAEPHVFVRVYATSVPWSDANHYDACSILKHSERCWFKLTSLCPSTGVDVLCRRNGSTPPHVGTTAKERAMVDKDRVDGSAKNIGGKLKEGVGNVTGDSKMQTEGKADQAEGKIQNTIGGIKDSIKDAFKKD